MKLSLCRAYPGLDPLRILDYPLVDVLDLIVEHVEHNNRPQPAAAGGEKIVWREAGDDWF